MDRIIYNHQPPYLYPLLTPTGTYNPASRYPGIQTSVHLPPTPAITAEKARQAAATATYNAYAAQAAASRAKVAAIHASRYEAAARLAILQPKVTPADKGNSWSLVGGAYRMGAATAPVTAPVCTLTPIPVPIYRRIPIAAPAHVPAPSGGQWTYGPAGYYVHR
ncbi:hypothetical protein BZA77DRAFT_293248 [Pyronema omphalodes]|nr:hypothetical protein BZA77DRAFT_293248 [Pyronema omphalodes]